MQHQTCSGPERRALAYLYGFRRVVVGLMLAGAVLGWVQQLPWLFGICVIVGLGEWLESSYYIGVLRWGRATGLAGARSMRAGDAVRLDATPADSGSRMRTPAALW